MSVSYRASFPVGRVIWVAVPHCDYCRTSSGHDVFIFCASNLDPSLGQDIFHGGAIELCELFVELTVREESLPENVDGGILVAKWNRDLLTVEESNIVMEWLAMMLLDSIEVSRELLKFLAIRELPNEGICELSEQGDEIVK